LKTKPCIFFFEKRKKKNNDFGKCTPLRNIVDNACGIHQISGSSRRRSFWNFGDGRAAGATGTAAAPCQ
jgi:hypothetical protein